MGGLNTTGLTNPQDYLLGRGKVYYAPLTSGLPTGGWRFLGNCPEFNVNVTTTRLEHKSSQAGLAVVDKSVVVSQECKVAFKLDELNSQNLALLFAGANSTPTNGAIAGFANYNMILAANAVQGKWYDIQSSTGVRCYDTLAADVTVKVTPAGATAVNGTDYILDQKMGRIQLVAGSAVLATGVGVDVAVAARGGAATLDMTKGLTTAPALAALKFIGENPANNNKQEEWQFHQIELASEGDVALISDKFAEVQLSGTAEINSTVDSTSPFKRVTHANS